LDYVEKARQHFGLFRACFFGLLSSLSMGLLFLFVVYFANNPSLFFLLFLDPVLSVTAFQTVTAEDK
jgi:hypothetical protein